jgi:hypothetical protein
MTTLIGLTCAQCGSPAANVAVLPSWRHGRLAVRGDIDDDVVCNLLLCPGCLEDEHKHDFDEGEGD